MSAHDDMEEVDEALEEDDKGREGRRRRWLQTYLYCIKMITKYLYAYDEYCWFTLLINTFFKYLYTYSENLCLLLK